MKLFIFASATLALVVSALNNTNTQSNNKNKRGVVDQSQIYGYKPFAIYQEPLVAAAALVQQHQGILPNSPKPISITYPHVRNNEPEATKVNPQIIYGYPSQETSIQNPLPNLPQVQQPPPPQFIFNPLPNTPAPINLYQNYQPAIQQQPHPIPQQPQINHLQSHLRNPSTFATPNIPKPLASHPKVFYGSVLHSNAPQAIIPNNPLPTTYQKPLQTVPFISAYKSASKLPLLPIIPNMYSLQQTHTPQPWKPMAAPPKLQKIEIKKETKPVVEEVVEDTEESNEEYNNNNDNDNSEEHYEEEDNDYDERKPYRSEKYKYDDDDESHEHYEEDEEEDEDNHRGSSKYYHKKPYKYHKKEYKPYKKYEDEDNYRYKSKKDYVAKPKGNKAFKSHYKSYEDREPRNVYKYKKNVKMNGLRSKMDEHFEDSQSMNVPVVHNKKVVQEKWFISKSHDMIE